MKSGEALSPGKIAGWDRRVESGSGALPIGRRRGVGGGGQFEAAAAEIERLLDARLMEQFAVEVVINEFAVPLGRYQTGVKKDAKVVGDISDFGLQEERQVGDAERPGLQRFDDL